MPLDRKYKRGTSDSPFYGKGETSTIAFPVGPPKAELVVPPKKGQGRGRGPAGFEPSLFWGDVVPSDLRERKLPK